MAPAQVGPVAALADVLQIGARNCQNYDLLKEAGAAGKPVMLKRGFGTTVEEWLSAAEYILAAGCADVLLCERGIRTFERATRGTLDLGGLLVARSLTHLPLLADPSHAAGRRELVPGLARAAWGAGVDGLMIEVHDAPESALCDGPQALLPDDLEMLLDEFGLLPGRTGSVERVRRAIDSVDTSIAVLAARRLELCRRVGEVKKATGRPIRDEAREATVRARFAESLGKDATKAASWRTPSSPSASRPRGGRATLLADDLDQDALGPSAVPLAVEDPLPRPEVEAAVRDRDDRLAAHELALDVRVRVVLPRVVVPPLPDGLVRDEGLEKARVVGVEAALVVVHEDGRRDVHRVHEAEALLDTALLHGGLDLGCDVHEADAGRDVQREDLTVGFHGRASAGGAGAASISRSAASAERANSPPGGATRTRSS